MSSETAYLAIMLDAPMQSWGFSSRFQRRTTGLHPTKSAVIGMICAAMGLAKGSEQEREELNRLRQLGMATIVIPRKRWNRWTGEESELPVLRLEDYHTVLGTRKASDPTGAKADPSEAVVTHRQYLLDALFGVVMEGDRSLLERVAEALRNPVWGIWLGRKNCIPAAPVCRGVFGGRAEAEKELLRGIPIEACTRVEDAPSFEQGNDTWSDGVPDSFADVRPWPVRRINQSVGK